GIEHFATDESKSQGSCLDLDQSPGPPENDSRSAGKKLARKSPAAWNSVETADEGHVVAEQTIDIVRMKGDVRIDPANRLVLSAECGRLRPIQYRPSRKKPARIPSPSELP